MEEKKRRTDVKAVITTILLLILFVFYTLTFFVPKFYGMTEKYVGLFVFAILVLVFLVNVNIMDRLKDKDKGLIALIALAVVTAANILIVDSGYGCFFVAVNFAMIFYLSSVMSFEKWQLWLFGAVYTGMLIWWFFGVYTWMFADYTSFAMNTNTAATFTVFSMMCVFVFFEGLAERYKAAQLFIVIALVKCLQISLYHRSRGAFAMLLAFFVLRFVIPKRLWEKKSFFNTVFIIATFGSLAFAAAYMIVGKSGANFKMPFFYKNVFSGREAIWLEMWEMFRKKPLTGIGTNVTITSFFEFNVHNAMLNILFIHGVIVFALTIYLMYRNLFAATDQIAARNMAVTALAAVFAVCIESYIDVDLIWTDYSMNVMFLLLAANFNKIRERLAEDGEDNERQS
ncbi:MAG: O-antigen ligase family protein [Lachnospiraceae bacterium]|nr:O-antigen ligase family protein [Lachnospiraceae bacterium]